MTMRVERIDLEGRGFEEILKSNEVRALLTQHASQVLASAKATAPVDSGAYRGSLAIEQATTDRAAVRVVANVEHSHVVEARHGTLARALDAAGGA